MVWKMFTSILSYFTGFVSCRKDMYKVNSSKSQMAKANSDTDKTKSVMDVKPEAGTFRRILPQVTYEL